jgi:protein phosphatase inhibitor 2
LDAKGEINAERRDRGEEVEFEEEMDEETAAKHAAFVRARGRHYSNEAEAMKKAAKLIAEDELAMGDTDSPDVSIDDGSSSQVNGVVHPT